MNSNASIDGLVEEYVPSNQQDEKKGLMQSIRDYAKNKYVSIASALVIGAGMMYGALNPRYANAEDEAHAATMPLQDEGKQCFSVPDLSNYVLDKTDDRDSFSDEAFQRTYPPEIAQLVEGKETFAKLFRKKDDRYDAIILKYAGKGGQLYGFVLAKKNLQTGKYDKTNYLDFKGDGCFEQTTAGKSLYIDVNHYFGHKKTLPAIASTE